MAAWPCGAKPATILPGSIKKTHRANPPVGLEGVLHLGGVTVHPNVFHGALERLPVAGWQVIDEGDRLRILLAGAADLDTAATADTVQRALLSVGVEDTLVTVDVVDAIPRTALGKAPLIRRALLATAGH